MNNEEINKMLAKRLTQAINESGLKISTILEATKMSRTRLYNKRTGRTKLSAEEAFFLAKVLKKPYNYFFPDLTLAKEQ